VKPALLEAHAAGNAHADGTWRPTTFWAGRKRQILVGRQRGLVRSDARQGRTVRGRIAKGIWWRGLDGEEAKIVAQEMTAIRRAPDAGFGSAFPCSGRRS